MDSNCSQHVLFLSRARLTDLPFWVSPPQHKQMDEVIDLTGSGDEQPHIQSRKKRRTEDISPSSSSSSCPWQPFYLTTVPHAAPPSNQCTLSVEDLFHQESDQGHSIEQLCLMSFMVDTEWLVSCCPHLLQVNTLILHGATASDSFSPSWQVSKVDLGMERYGTHHSKMALVFYDTGLRVVITTANFYAEDFIFRTQGIFLQDFPLKSDPCVKNASEKNAFEEDLVAYLKTLRLYSQKAQNSLENVINRLSNYDFSSAEVILIASVPGRHTKDKKKWGLGKLCHALAENGFYEKKWRDYQLLMQCSSLGSMGKDGMLLHDYAARMRLQHPPSAKSKQTCDFQLVWPTVDCVRESFQGYASGGSLPCNWKTLTTDGQHLLTGFQDRLFRWEGGPSGRERATPHMKCYFRHVVPPNKLEDQVVELAWFLLTSSNMSQAAFGVFQTNDSQLYIKSYEIGVLFLSNKIKTACRRFSCTPCHPVLGVVAGEECNRDDEMQTVFVVKSGKYRTPVCEGRRLIVPFSIPFAVPPTPYKTKDEPWVWDKAFSKPDCLGEMRLDV